MKHHTVLAGESLWSIAEAYYGDGALDVHIFNANQMTIKDINRVYPGQVIVIPHLPHMRWAG